MATAKWTDRVQALKVERSDQGGDDADIDEVSGAPLPLNPQEDALECAGLILNNFEQPRDEAVYVQRDGDDIRFVDVNNPTGKTVSELASGGLTPNEASQVVIANDTPAFTQATPVCSEDGWLVNDDGDLLVE